MHSQRRDLSSAGTLPAISEDGNDVAIHSAGAPMGRGGNSRYNGSSRSAAAPLQGQGSWTSRGWARGQSSDSPNSYNSMSETSSSEADHEQEKRLNDLRERPQIAKRGGWRRLGLLVVVAILCLVALGVGLGVGLSRRNSTNNSSTASSGNNSTNTTSMTGFPAGSYAVQTFLKTVTTNCTSNPATWRCYPYSTYAESSTLSAATFSWVINATASPNGGSPTYMVSSAENPFSIVFPATPLTLMDVGQPTEYYSFVLTGLNKPVVPAAAITSNNAAATCYFNQTHLEGRLYTKMAKTYPPSSSPSGDQGSNGQGGVWAAWPYAATVSQYASGGANVPQCFDVNGNSVGTFAAQNGGECSCLYQNNGT